MSTVLVTGGSGFIGSYLVRDLVEHGHRVVNADVRPPQGSALWRIGPVADQVEYRTLDVADASAVSALVADVAPDAIVHIAAVVDPIALNTKPALAIDVNIGGTFAMLEAARDHGVGRFVLFSSIGVLPPIQFEPTTVDHPIFLADHGMNVSFYGAAKVASEALAWAYHDSYGLDHMIVRPSAVYGFGQQYPIFIKPMVEDSLAGKPVSFPTGRDFPRDYTHAADIAQLARLAVEKPADEVDHRVFFGATGEPLVTAGELASVITELIPEARIEVGPGLDAMQEIDAKCRGVLSIENARQQLGYEPRFPDVRSGLADYISELRRYEQETQ